MSGLEIGAALGVLAVAVWIKRLATVGVYIKASIMVLAVLASTVFLGIIEIGYNPGRVWELGELVIGLVG